MAESRKTSSIRRAGNASKKVKWCLGHSSKQQKRNSKSPILSLPNISLYHLPLFQDEAKSVSMVRHSMNIVKQAKECLARFL